jgi:hypothetical protein
MDVKEAASAALGELEDALSRCTRPDSEVIDDDMKSDLLRRLDESRPLVDALTELADDESQTLVEGFSRLSERIARCDAVQPVIAGLDPLGEAQGIELLPARRPARSISNDVCWSFFYTVCFSLVFAAIWTQYSKTH